MVRSVLLRYRGSQLWRVLTEGTRGGGGPETAEEASGPAMPSEADIFAKEVGLEPHRYDGLYIDLKDVRKKSAGHRLEDIGALPISIPWPSEKRRRDVASEPRLKSDRAKVTCKVLTKSNSKVY